MSTSARDASSLARADGNAAFKRGRWAEAAAHYTRAIQADPTDAVPYANRAQAWIKLERWTDAEDDCSNALAVDKGNVKAMYRRALARRAQGRLDSAADDLRTVLVLDPNNSAANSELADVDRERERATAATATTTATLDGSSPTPTPAHSTLKPTPNSTAATPLAPPPAVPSPSPPAPAPAPAAGFAALRKSRDARPAFASASASASASERPRPPASTSTPTPTPNATPTPVPGRVVTLPADPTSTSPGSGLQLIRALAELTPREGWVYLRAYPPRNVGLVVRPVLEPDSLGRILVALHAGLVAVVNNDADAGDFPAGGGGPSDDAATDTDAVAWVRAVMDGLRSTARWKMNVAMLTAHERRLGNQVCDAAGLDPL